MVRTLDVEVDQALLAVVADQALLAVNVRSLLSFMLGTKVEARERDVFGGGSWGTGMCLLPSVAHGLSSSITDRGDAIGDNGSVLSSRLLGGLASRLGRIREDRRLLWAEVLSSVEDFRRNLSRRPGLGLVRGPSCSLAVSA